MSIVNLRLEGAAIPKLASISLSLSRFILPLLLTILVVALAISEPRFVGPLNLMNLSRNISFLTIVSIGQMIVMILGGLDLSVGAVVAFSSVTTAIVMNRTIEAFPGSELTAILVASAAALGVSMTIGVINGLCVAKAKASAFIVTLGTFSIIGGLSYYITAGIPIYGMPASFTNSFGRGLLLGLPYSVYLALAIVALIFVVQRYTRFGRYLYAVGGSISAARVSGLPVDRLTVASYAACSTLAGLAGILITARIGGGQANLGSDFMLQSIAVAVVAGVSLRGGVGRVEMVLLSAVFITIFANAMNLVRIDSKVQTIVFGLVLLFAVFVDRKRTGEIDE